MASLEWQIGSRVLVAPENDVATVRYVGAVAGTDGEWVGVEFDAAGRGKHDGVHQGVRYFTCSATAGPQAASFVRPHKLRRGSTLLEALVTKYEQGNAASNAGKSKDASRAASDAAAGAAGEEEPYVVGARGRRIVVELCMKEELMEGQRHLDKLVRAYLPDACVSSVGAPGEVAQAAGAITVLDLQARAPPVGDAASSWALTQALLCKGALLPDWASVARLNEELPALQVLNLSRVCNVLPEGPVSGTPFARLRTLVLNASGATWQQVCRLQPVLSALVELHMCDCGITSLSEDATVWPQLRVLNLDGNALSEWSEISSLGHQPLLEQLHLSGNQLTTVEPPPNDAAFPLLRTLLLAGNKIAEWSSVDALDRYPALIETRLSGNPVVEVNPHTRHEVVARVQGLTMLNGSLIGRAERRDAEIRYLRRALDEAGGAAGAADATVTSRHPRIAQLLGKIGDLAPGGGGAAAPVGGACLADDMLNLTLSCVAASAGERLPTAKRMPRTLTVARLKQLCERLFHVPATRMVLFVRRPGTPMPEPLVDEQRDLYWLGVSDGDTILVDEARL